MQWSQKRESPCSIDLDTDLPLFYKSLDDTTARSIKIKHLYKWDENRTCVSYSQNLGEVCTNYSWSLCRLQLKSPESTMYLRIYLRVLTGISTCTYFSVYAYLLEWVRVLILVSTSYSFWSASYLREECASPTSHDRVTSSKFRLIASAFRHDTSS